MSDSSSETRLKTQPEQALEDELVAKLIGLDYQRVAVSDEPSMLANLKVQLEAFNEVTITDGEFSSVVGAFGVSLRRAP